MAEWIERSPRIREVAGLNPDRVKPRALKVVLVVSSLDAQHYANETKTGLRCRDNLNWGCTRGLCLRHVGSTSHTASYATISNRHVIIERLLKAT